MAFMAPIFAGVAGKMMVAATVMSFIGSMKQAKAEKELGQAKQTLANFKADQLNVMAGQTRAHAQRAALAQRRKGTLAQSRALALAAASGGGTGGTVENIMAGIDAESDYAYEMELYEGEERARNLELDAKGERYSGAQEAIYGAKKSQATMWTAAGKLASGFAGGLTEKYAPVAGDAYQPAMTYYGR